MLTTDSALRKDLRTGLSNLDHRHFTTIAAIIKMMDGANYSAESPRWLTAQHFANELAATNPRFDRARFLKACGVVS